MSYYALVIVFPEGGGNPGCRWGNWGLCGDFAAYLCPRVEEMKGLSFITPQTKEKYGDFASTKSQGNWERAFIVIYGVNQSWGTFTVNVLEKKNCQTVSQTK